MWNGAFRPFDITKHRDYEHSNYFEHLMSNGGKYEIGPARAVNSDPITDDTYDPPHKYYEVSLFVPKYKEDHEDKYVYLISAEGDGSEPNVETIAKEVDQYARNPLPGGTPRIVDEYIDWEETINKYGIGAISDERLEWIRMNQPWVYRQIQQKR